MGKRAISVGRRSTAQLEMGGGLDSQSEEGGGATPTQFPQYTKASLVSSTWLGKAHQPWT